MTETFRPLKTSLLCEAYLIFYASSLSDFLTLPFLKLTGVKGLKIKNKTVEFNIKRTFEFIQFMSLVSQFIISCLHAAFNEIYERMTGEKKLFSNKKTHPKRSLNNFAAQPCENIDTPLNGTMNCSGLVTDASCSFSCDPGYDLVGSQFRTCLPSSRWSGNFTFCKGKCYHLFISFEMR